MIFLLYLILLCLIFLVLKKFVNQKKNRNHKKTFHDIPGPDGLPIVGNIPVGDDFEVWKTRKELALRHYPVYRLTIYGMDIVFILQPEDIECVLNTSSKVIKGPMYDVLRKFVGNGMLNRDGRTWHERRKLLTKSFHFKVLSKYLHIFDKEVDTLAAKFGGNLNQPIDILSSISTMALKIINATIFGEGIKVEDTTLSEYKKSADIMSKLVGRYILKPYLGLLFYIPGLNTQLKNATAYIREFVFGILKEKVDESRNLKTIHEKSENMLDILVSHPDVFDDESIINEINTFIHAGHDTTSAGLTFALMALANYPEYQNELYKEIVEIVGETQTATHAQLKSMNYLDRFLKESLRRFSPVSSISRQITEELVLKSGYTLHPGTVILIHFYDIHNNPNNFPDPEKFDPDRFLPENIQGRHPFAFIPFSAGPRNCIAQKFAILEMKHTICKILQKFRLEPGTLIKDLVFVPNLSLQTKNSVKVKFVPRLLHN